MNDINRIMFLIRTQTDIIDTLTAYGVSDPVARLYVRTVVAFTINYRIPKNIPIQRKVTIILDDFKTQNKTAVFSLIAAGVPFRVVNRITRRIIRITLIFKDEYRGIIGSESFTNIIAADI